MRMASCPICGEGGANNFKGKTHLWYSKCYRCGFTSNVGMPTRKMARYNWNRLCEHMTGEELPDEATGRMPRSFMKKEVQCGVPSLVDCLTQEDFKKWEEKYDISKIDWVNVKGKKRKRGQKVKFQGTKHD